MGDKGLTLKPPYTQCTEGGTGSGKDLKGRERWKRNRIHTTISRNPFQSSPPIVPKVAHSLHRPTPRHSQTQTAVSSDSDGGCGRLLKNSPLPAFLVAFLAQFYPITLSPCVPAQIAWIWPSSMTPLICFHGPPSQLE